ncbi:uncharacterized protein LOC143038991 [Oratosquilla oratoria]|uniref:uncharacterized protein LOC143038991 n=1 Tax=Oratosquilla oratoria TaxID=337810 RepID=UPI003F758CBF
MKPAFQMKAPSLNLGKVTPSSGVAFAVKTKLLNSIPHSPTGHNERLISWRIPIRNSRYVTLVHVYAPTLDSDDEIKDRFSAQLNDITQAIPREEKIILLGDFNARVGSSHHLWEGVLGRHGVGKCNDNGLCLLTFCFQDHLTITNTMFQLQNKFKTTWMHPRSKIWHLLDYVIVRRNDIKDVKITRAMRGADGWTHHRLVRSILHLKIRLPTRRQAPKKQLDLKALNIDVTRSTLQIELLAYLTLPATTNDPMSTEYLTEKWDSISEVLLNTAKDVLGFSKRRHRDLFDEQSEGIHQLIDEKNRAHQAVIVNPNSTTRSKLANLRSKVQHETRKMQNEWWTNLATEIQGFADTGDQHQFYNPLKTAYGRQSNNLCPVRSADGSTLFTEKTDILSLPNLPVIQELDDIPTIQEVSHAINSLKNNKATGPDGIPAELLKHGGNQAIGFGGVWMKISQVIACLELPMEDYRMPSPH